RRAGLPAPARRAAGTVHTALRRRHPHGDSSPWSGPSPRSTVILSSTTSGRCTGTGRGREPPGRGTRTVNATKGMNVEEVRRMSAQLRDAAEEITRIEQELTSGLEGV